jgi:hypothetical protein
MPTIVDYDIQPDVGSPIVLGRKNFLYAGYGCRRRDDHRRLDHHRDLRDERLYRKENAVMQA